MNLSHKASYVVKQTIKIQIFGFRIFKVQETKKLKIVAKMKVAYYLLIGQALCSSPFYGFQSVGGDSDAALDWLASYDKHSYQGTQRRHERSSDFSSDRSPPEFQKQRTNTNKHEQRLMARFFKSVPNTKRNRQRFESFYHTYNMDRFFN